MSDPSGVGNEVEQADDLFGRWLAHHARQVDDEEQELASEATRGAASPAPASSAGTDMDRQVPGFEPVIMPSMRKKQEASSARRGLRRKPRSPDEAAAAAAGEGPGEEPGEDTSPPAGWAPQAPLHDAPSTPPPAPPTAGRRVTRSTSGAAPDWLTDLRGTSDSSTDSNTDSSTDTSADASTDTEVDPIPAPVTDTVEPSAEPPAEPGAPGLDDAPEAVDLETEQVAAEPEPEVAQVEEVEGADVVAPEPGVAEAELVDEPEIVEPDPEPETEVVEAELVDEPDVVEPDPEPEAVEAVAPEPGPVVAEAPTPPRAGVDLDWLAIIRDPGSRYTPDAPAPAPAPEPVAEADADAEPEAGQDAAVEVEEPPTHDDQSAEAEPETTVEEAQPEPEPEPAETVPEPSWVDKLRGTEGVEEEPHDDATVLDETPDQAEPAAQESGTDWKSRFSDTVEATAAAEAAEAAEAETAAATPEPAVVVPASEPTAKKTEEPAARPETRTTPITSMPEEYRFKPRRTTRLLVTAVLGLGVLVTAWLASRAYQDPSQTTVALAAVAAFVTAVVWAVRATTVVTHLTVRGGELEVVRGGDRFVVDLTSATSPIELVGTPGERGWRAMVVRRGQPPFELTASAVDPVELTRVVRFHRPGQPTSQPTSQPT